MRAAIMLTFLARSFRLKLSAKLFHIDFERNLTEARVLEGANARGFAGKKFF